MKRVFRPSWIWQFIEFNNIEPLFFILFLPNNSKPLFFVCSAKYSDQRTWKVKQSYQFSNMVEKIAIYRYQFLNKSIASAHFCICGTLSPWLGAVLYSSPEHQPCFSIDVTGQDSHQGGGTGHSCGGTAFNGLQLNKFIAKVNVFLSRLQAKKKKGLILSAEQYLCSVWCILPHPPNGPWNHRTH